jgi:hypothetical protein
VAKALKTIDVGDSPEIMRLVEEVRASNEPRLLRRDGEDLVIVLPAKQGRRSSRTKTPADYAAFRSAAGSWQDIDTDKLIADIYESRRRSSRPSIDL